MHFIDNKPLIQAVYLQNLKVNRSPRFRFSDPDMRHLRAFVSIVEFGGLSAAAAELGASLASLSRSVAALETRFGVKLCNRGRAGFSLSSHGRDVYTAAQALIEDLGEFEIAIFNIARSSRAKLKLGIIDNTLSAPGTRMIAAIEEFTNAFPEINFDISVLAKPNIEAAVKDGRIDIGVTGDPLFFQSLNYVKLTSEIHHMYASPRLAAERASDPSQIPYVKRRFKAATFEAIEKRNHLTPVATAGSVEAVAMLVASSVGMGILPSHYVDANPKLGLQIVAMPGTPLIAPFYAIHRNDAADAPIIGSFIKLLAKDCHTP